MRRSIRPAAAVVVASLGLVGLVAPVASAAEPTELFISEYVEGSSNNKAIEIYNPTTAPIDLAAGGYALQQYFNGSTTAGLTIALTGTVAPGDVYVFAHSSAVFGANPEIPDPNGVVDQTAGGGFFNGDDAVALAKAGALVDVIGQIGFDPGTAWVSNGVSTLNSTLRRNADICVGDPNGADVFVPSAEWTGFPTDNFDGLGAHTAVCGDNPPTVVINEFVANHVGTDTNEYIELLVTSGATDLSGYSVLSIEGDATATNSPTGVVDAAFTFGAPDAEGRSWTGFRNNALENGTMTLLLVTGTAPTAGTDLDVDNDGVLDDGFSFEIVDAVAISDNGAGDLTYGIPVLDPAFAGGAFAPGGASRFPDGTDTDTSADWVVNDFDLAGIPMFTGTLVDGEAVNTPGTANALTLPPDPEPEEQADCDIAPVTIGSVQGSGAASPVQGQTVRVEGVVTGDFQVGGFQGYYVQDAGDGDPATSDGIFVFAPGGAEVATGDEVHVLGEVSEFNGLTEITAADVAICASGVALPEPVALELPVDPAAYEPLEGMRVTLPQSLSILEYFDFDRFGTIEVGLGRQMTPTAVVEPGSAEYTALLEKNLAERITIDDGRSSQNPDPAIHPNGDEFTLSNTFRGGDQVKNVTGVLDWRFSTWAVQPTQGAEFTVVNPRPEVPEVGGDVTVASFNVLNYFTTIDPTPTNSNDDDYTRGADTAEELARQQAKIVAALAAIDADVYGLIEIENSGVVGFEDSTAAPDTAVATLTEALNAAVGAGTYEYLATGPVGTDAITTAMVYKPAAVQPVGAFATLTQADDPRWLDDKNRPALAQTFADVETGETVTVVVNHLKSKGSACTDVQDPDAGDGQGNCNGVRTRAALAMADWLAGDPTGQGAGRELIIGDLNSYDKEDPIDALVAAGYTDLVARFGGENAYSYVFDGMLGYLDYALAGTALAGDVTGTAVWHINADEADILDYDMSFKQPAQDALFAADPYRSSDHDPVVVGLDMTPDTTAPEISATATPSSIFPPNNKWTDVTVSIEATDDSGEVTVTLTGAEAAGSHKAAIQTIDDTTFRVVAAIGAIYTITYEAMDAAGNTATAQVVVTVGPARGPSLF
ncbi:ExeM/NucH family extracellular endonuclease [Microbacterium hominis]|uniref:ExeM/NucH family extracellular endonuclease n=1 Tax=Microbacterium hominis TaxID=162426 RepID=A0A7D4UHJ1_9MICO|nr:ExeM/NucH family extracellular endonuclease [Microbacterium hominis]QKJ20929.1 ExeM/NucH family extracellular endonuclease [Microbacterium hominis]